MFRFEYGTALWFLWAIPILIGLYVLFTFWRRRQQRLLAADDLFARLALGWTGLRHHVRFILITLGVLFLIFGYANPQWGNKTEKVKAESSDVFIALDISQSMMAEDISPNRLERAKRLLQNVIQDLKGNRIGLIFFAGNAYLQMPLSNDYSAAELFIAAANTNQATTQGTAISEAIDLALRAYEEGKSNQRGLIIITDGESHDDDALAKAREAKEKGLNVFTIGVGTSEGAFVPFISQGRQQYKRDEQGNPVTSALNTTMITDLANAGGGKSYLIGEGNSILVDLRKQVDRLQKQEVETRAFTEFASYFQYFLILGLLFMILEFMIPERSAKIIS